MGDVVSRNPGEREFHHAVRTVVESVAPFLVENPQFIYEKILEKEWKHMIQFGLLFLLHIFHYNFIYGNH